MRLFLKLFFLSSLYSRYYAEACNEWRRPSPRLSAWTTQLRRNVAVVASHWPHHTFVSTGPGFEPQTYCTDRSVFNRQANWPVCHVKSIFCLPSQKHCSKTPSRRQVFVELAPKFSISLPNKHNAKRIQITRLYFAAYLSSYHEKAINALYELA